jgi:Tol biopolymer transport system component
MAARPSRRIGSRSIPSPTRGPVLETGPEWDRNTGRLRSFWRIVAAPALVCFSLTGSAEAAPEHAEIAFESNGRIWSSRADGSERRLLIAPGRAREGLTEPVWSPDGSRLAYVSFIEDGDRAHLMLLDAAGNREITPLRKGVADQSPAWSPDGTTLAFSRFMETRTGIRSSILTRVLAGGAERGLVTTSTGARLRAVGEPSWSPDGATIAYTHSKLERRSYFRPDIRTVAADGGASRLLIRDAQSPAWSPDGRRLAFASVRDRNGSRCGSDECSYAGELYTAAADGSALTRLTVNEGDDAVPAWSPDGSRILFTSDRNLPEGDSYEVYSVAAEGSCLTWLTNGTPASLAATWRPGSGTRFDPGGCDPGSRAPLTDGPMLPALRGGLWLGTRYRGLLLSRVERMGRATFVAYDDCELFDPRACPQPVHLSHEAACSAFAFRGLTSNAYRFLRRRGAIVSFYGREASARVLSGHGVTSIDLARGNRLPAIYRVLRGLRPFEATLPPRRLPPPRVPRALARRLESTTRTYRRYGTLERAARVLGISRFHLRGRLRLRRALRSFGPYRISSCDAAERTSGGRPGGSA